MISWPKIYYIVTEIFLSCLLFYFYFYANRSLHALYIYLQVRGLIFQGRNKNQRTLRRNFIGNVRSFIPRYVTHLQGKLWEILRYGISHVIVLSTGFIKLMTSTLEKCFRANRSNLNKIWENIYYHQKESDFTAFGLHIHSWSLFTSEPVRQTVLPYDKIQ